jgi:hypothetical protein
MLLEIVLLVWMLRYDLEISLSNYLLPVNTNLSKCFFNIYIYIYIYSILYYLKTIECVTKTNIKLLWLKIPL